MVRRWLYRRLPFRLRKLAASILGVPGSGAFSVEIGDRRVVLKDPGGSRVGTEMYVHGYDDARWERATRTVFEELLAGEPSVVFDVGANVGLYTVVACCINEDNRVVAFEPVQESAQYLQDVLEANGFSGVDVECVALSDEPGEKELFVRETRRYDDAATLDRDRGMEREDLRSGIVRTVPTTTLDAFVDSADLADLDLLKVDVEGTELAVLEGGLDTIERFEPDILLEVMMENSDPGKLRDLLDRMGYDRYLITSGGLIPEDRFLRVPKHDNPGQVRWLNHLATSRDESEVRKLSVSAFGRYLD